MVADATNARERSTASGVPTNLRDPTRDSWENAQLQVGAAFRRPLSILPSLHLVTAEQFRCGSFGRSGRRARFRVTGHSRDLAGVNSITTTGSFNLSRHTACISDVALHLDEVRQAISISDTDPASPHRGHAGQLINCVAEGLLRRKVLPPWANDASTPCFRSLHQLGAGRRIPRQQGEQRARPAGRW